MEELALGMQNVCVCEGSGQNVSGFKAAAIMNRFYRNCHIRTVQFMFRVSSVVSFVPCERPTKRCSVLLHKHFDRGLV